MDKAMKAITGCLGLVRMLIGLLQSALLLGGCASLLLPGSGLFSACVIWFLILCVVQLGIVGIVAMMGGLREEDE